MKKAPKWTITLKQGHRFPSINDDPETIWTIVGLTNSVEFEIGQILTRRDLQELCSSSLWKVIIK